MPALNTQENINLRAEKEGQGLRRAVPSFASFAFANRVDVDGSAVLNYQSLDIQTHLKSETNQHNEASDARLAPVVFTMTGTMRLTTELWHAARRPPMPARLSLRN
jgi:hypothetical protein